MTCRHLPFDIIALLPDGTEHHTVAEPICDPDACGYTIELPTPYEDADWTFIEERYVEITDRTGV